MTENLLDKNVTSSIECVQKYLEYIEILKDMIFDFDKAYNNIDEKRLISIITKYVRIGIKEDIDHNNNHERWVTYDHTADIKRENGMQKEYLKNCFCIHPYYISTQDLLVEANIFVKQGKLEKAVYARPYILEAYYIDENENILHGINEGDCLNRVLKIQKISVDEILKTGKAKDLIFFAIPEIINSIEKTEHLRFASKILDEIFIMNNMKSKMSGTENRRYIEKKHHDSEDISQINVESVLTYIMINFQKMIHSKRTLRNYFNTEGRQVFLDILEKAKKQIGTIIDNTSVPVKWIYSGEESKFLWEPVKFKDNLFEIDSSILTSGVPFEDGLEQFAHGWGIYVDKDLNLYKGTVNGKADIHEMVIKQTTVEKHFSSNIHPISTLVRQLLARTTEELRKRVSSEVYYKVYAEQLKKVNASRIADTNYVQSNSTEIAKKDIEGYILPDEKIESYDEYNIRGGTVIEKKLNHEIDNIIHKYIPRNTKDNCEYDYATIKFIRSHSKTYDEWEKRYKNDNNIYKPKSSKDILIYDINNREIKQNIEENDDNIEVPF